ncbi:general secretion pathway protein GspB [Fontivita pretiosa]|uniref:general secretion pathway protein GspB n=1 Tax=Fontivita pretiosa TaxID=2989684 RepID=UPI003D1804D4
MATNSKTTIDPFNHDDSGEQSASTGIQMVEALNGGGDSEGQVDESLVVAEQKPAVSRGTIVMFVILVIGAAGLYFMYRRAGPSTANATVTRETAEAKKTITGFLSGGDANIKAMERMIRSTEKIVEQFLAYPSMTQVPLSALRTNPFRAHAEQKKQDDGALSAAAEAKRREEERRAILKAVQSLQLQSIMYSESRRACMINNTLYREGQQIDNFTIEKINPASVVVKQGTYRFELPIQR